MSLTVQEHYLSICSLACGYCDGSFNAVMTEMCLTELFSPISACSDLT